MSNEKFVYGKDEFQYGNVTKACEKCNDCKYKQSQIMSCKKYDRKPKEVVLNGICRKKDEKS